MAYVSFPILLFCIVMTASALRAMQRYRQQGERGKSVNPRADQP
jgi:hypothetical protein